jgi:hypothetical protein
MTWEQFYVQIKPALGFCGAPEIAQIVCRGIKRILRKDEISETLQQVFNSKENNPSGYEELEERRPCKRGGSQCTDLELGLLERLSQYMDSYEWPFTITEDMDLIDIDL